LYIDAEAYGVGVEIDDHPALFDTIPTTRSWPIIADSARPELISYMKRQGFRISSAKKGKGSINAGIERIRNFKKVIIHPRCKQTIEEFKLYSYKVNSTTGDIMPIPEDKYNHCISGDALITTNNGLKRMDSIQIGDMVLTRLGYREVSAFYYMKVQRTFLLNGMLKCTSDHKIWTHKGFVEVDALRYGDVLLESWNKKQQCTTERCITDTQSQNCQTTRTISEEGVFTFIGKYGKMPMVKFLKAIISTTKMVILETIVWITLCSLHQNNTVKSMRNIYQKKLLGRDVRTLIISDILQRSGIGLRKAVFGIKNMASWDGKQGRKLKQYVRNAEKSLPLRHIIKNIAAMLVNLAQEGNLELTISNGHALFAVKGLSQANIQEQYIVLALAQTVQRVESNKVYDITVEEAHEFFADGILVSNCVDSLRYATERYKERKPQAENINMGALGL
jgi:hypothetical protein